MPSRGSPAATRAPGPSPDLPIARVVAVLLILLPIGAFLVITNLARSDPSPAAPNVSAFDPRSMFSDTTPHFLPTPVAALPPEINTGPPAPAAGESAPATAPTERVKIANTGGAGAILRADPPKGRQVSALRDGTVLQVIEHRQVDDGSDWLHVRTPDGVEGWVYSRLVAPAD